MGLEAQEPSCLSLGRGQAELPPVALEVGEGWKLRGRGGNPADSKNQDNSAVEESLSHELLPLVAGHRSSIAAVRRWSVVASHCPRSGLGAIPLPNIGSMGGEYGPLQRRRSGKARAVPVRCPSILAVFSFAAINPFFEPGRYSVRREAGKHRR